MCGPSFHRGYDGGLHSGSLKKCSRCNARKEQKGAMNMANSVTEGQEKYMNTSSAKKLPAINSNWRIDCPSDRGFGEGKWTVVNFSVNYDRHDIVHIIGEENILRTIGISTFNGVARPWEIPKVSAREIIAMQPCLDGIILIAYCTRAVNIDEMKNLWRRARDICSSPADVSLQCMKAMLLLPSGKMDEKFTLREWWEKSPHAYTISDNVLWLANRLGVKTSRNDTLEEIFKRSEQ